MSTRPDEDSFCPGRQPVAQAWFGTPWGRGCLSVRRGLLVAVDLPPVPEPDGRRDLGVFTKEDLEPLERWVTDLEAYFRGEKLSWCPDEVEHDLEGMTAFGLRTVRALLSVPAGTTISYGGLAKLAGHPRAARAVGTVMACNPIPIVVPCHRVIRSDGSLGRYGTDASWKERLLMHERSNAKAG